MKKSQHQIVYRKLSELKKLPNNPRTIKKDDMERLKKSVKDNPDYFEARPVILSDRTGELVIIAGNQRFEAAKALGLSEIPTVLLEELTEEREREIIIRDNVANGEWDMDILANEWDVGELADWGLDVDWDTPEEIVEDEAPEVDEVAEPESKRGEIYQLGEHRLMCGDSTVEENVKNLMCGAVADMVFTDPPYGVGVKGLHTGKILNDDLKGEELEAFLKLINENLEYCCTGNIYICYEIKNSVENFNAFGKPDEVICFVKDNSSFPIKGKYHRKFETILFYENGKPINSNTATNVWYSPYSNSLANKDENGLGILDKGNFCNCHPTTKPLPIPSEAIKNSSRVGETVLDLFGGSGSTLIACEQLDRRCYMMELDQRYCDVIRKRYWKFKTGSEEGWQEGTPCLKK